MLIMLISNHSNSTTTFCTLAFISSLFCRQYLHNVCGLLTSEHWTLSTKVVYTSCIICKMSYKLVNLMSGNHKSFYFFLSTFFHRSAAKKTNLIPFREKIYDFGIVDVDVKEQANTILRVVRTVLYNT